MARKTGGQRRAELARPEFIGYVRHNISAEEKAQFDQWQPGVEYLKNALDRICQGYTVSVKWDGFNETFQCALTCTSKSSVNAGYVLVARAPDCYSAIELAIFKHFILLGEDWSAYFPTSKPEGDRSWG